jgi:subtilisin family serine protease
MAQYNTNMYLAKKIIANEANPIDVFVKGNIETIKKLTAANGGTFKDAAGDIAIVSIAPKNLAVFFSDKAIESIEFYPNTAKPLNDTLLTNLNATNVHNGTFPLPQAYTGAGVVMGFIDTGIDFTHPDFKNTNGTTRIKFLWDQTLTTSTNTPTPFNYGQEFKASDIDAGLANAHDATNWGGHGTQSAGIGAGNGLASGTFKGVAPETDIIMVALDFYSTSHSVIADGVNYIYTKAAALGKPCVINASLGGPNGPHDGKDNQSQYIKNKINQTAGRSFVAAAGNDGITFSHVGYNVSTDTSFTWFVNNNGSIYLQLWANTTTFNNVNFAVGVDQLSPSYSPRGSTPFSTIASHLGIVKRDTIYKNGNRIGIVTTLGSSASGNYSMEFLIEPDSANYVWSLRTNGNGRFDTWSYDAMSIGLPSVSDVPKMVYYKMPDNNQTVMGGFQCLDNVITVGNYSNLWGYIDVTGTLIFQQDVIAGNLIPGSSRGPTRDNRIKPEVTAPGDMTLTTYVLALVPNVLANFPDALTQDTVHVRSGGTSMSCPGVAGIAALYLQRYPSATAVQVKNAIINCTIQDNFTSTTLPDNNWGYGKANAYGALTGCASVGINNNALANELLFEVFPNPTNGQQSLSVLLNEWNTNDTYSLNIYDVLGNLVYTSALKSAKTSIAFSANAGIYLCELGKNKQRITAKKLIVR